MVKPSESCARCGKQRGPEDTTHIAYCRECWRTYQRDRYHGRLPALETGTCVWCGKSYQQKQRRPSNYCSRACREEWRYQSPEYRDWYLQHTYGISAAEYDRMLASQGGGCALCGKRAEEQKRYGKYLHVDHDHDTGRVRGLLCDRHNLLIGQWDHDSMLLRRAAEYIESAGRLEGDLNGHPSRPASRVGHDL
jgi:Recombination endonuclease VII